MKAELFPFQKRALADLRLKAGEAIGGYQRTHSNQVVSFTAPTGAGKTIIMALQLKKLYNTFVLSVLAGMMIGFGGTIYLMCSNKIVGATLFSFGLLTIVCQGFALYTGRVGYFRQYGVASLATTILGNLVGTTLVAKAFLLTRHSVDVASVVAPKLADSSWSIFLLSVGCGVMMYLAVDSYRKSRSWLFVILPIVIFILCILDFL